MLEQSSNKSKVSNPLIDLVTQLNESIVYTSPDNVKTNKKLWDNYSKEWDASKEWVQKMATSVNMNQDLVTLGASLLLRAVRFHKFLLVM